MLEATHRIEHRKIPIFGSAKLVYGLVFRHRAFAIQIILPWIGVALALSAVFYVTTGEAGMWFDAGAPPPTEAKALSYFNSPSVWIPLIVSSIGWASIAVIWHRLVLLGERSGQWRLKVDAKAFIYAAFAILIGIVSLLLAALAVLVIAIPVGMISIGIGVIAQAPSQTLAAIIGLAAGTFVGLATTLLFMLFWARFGIALPAIAVGDKSMGMGRSWKSSKRNGWRLVAISFLIIFPVFVLQMVVQLFVSDNPIAQVPVGLASHALSFFYALNGVTLLSIAYGFFIEGRPIGAQEPAAPLSEAAERIEPGDSQES